MQRQKRRKTLTPTEERNLQLIVNNAETDYEDHLAGEDMCLTAASAAYKAEVDGSTLKNRYNSRYLDKCFNIIVEK
ncbi:MAG: hypothetical protein LBJ98_04540 [Endomicrobium sp.]|nr:hypothetical protein [Endomicrobium sp.]